MLRPFIGIGFLAWAGGALAEPVAVANGDLKDLVSGALVEIDTPLGTKIPVRFGNDGLVSGQALDLAPLLGSEKDRGRWWVDGEKLCSKWFRWFDAEVRCITVRQDGARLFWRKDDGETGTATLVERGTPEKPAASPPPSTILAEAKAAPSAPAPSTETSAPQKSASDEIPLPRKKPAPPVVFAAADAAGASAEYKAAAAETSVSPSESSPSAKDAVSDAPVQPTEVALADPAQKADVASDGEPIMRFGGNGLLEASSRVGTDRAATGAASAPAEAAKSPGSGGFSPIRKATPSAPKVAALPTPSAHTAQHPPGKLRTASTSATTTPAKPGNSHAAARPPVRPVVLYRVRGVDRDDVLNVRRGPSEQHDQIAAIPPSGRRVVITGPCEEVWCPIQYGRIKGWVNSLYLAEEVPQAASSSEVYTAKR